jgi:hypothetical protein
MHLHALIAAMLLVLPGALSAQAHPLAGTWNVTVPAGVRIENGEPSVIIAKGVLNVTVSGDSLIGTLAVEPPEGMPARPASRLAARLGPAPTTFVSVTQATINTNGEESQRTVTSRFTIASAEGDAFTGTVTRVIEGMEGPLSEPHPFTGTRAKPAG